MSSPQKEDGDTPRHSASWLPTQSGMPAWRELGVSAGVGRCGYADLVMAIRRFFELPNVSLIYLLAVLVAAVYGGYTAALAAAALSALAYNFFFIDPVHTLHDRPAARECSGC